MPRKAENWLLVEWTDSAENVVYVKSVLSPDIKKLKTGESITVNWQGEPRPAVLKERSCNRDELEAKIKANEPGPSSEPGSNDEEEAFSASGSSWVPSDGALSNDSYTEKPAKKVKLEKTKHQYVNRRTSKRVITPSHRAIAVIPKKMQNQEGNSKKNDSGSGRKLTHTETVQSNVLNKTAPESSTVKQNNKKNSNRKRCKLGVKELEEMGETFRSLFQMIRELKKPFENTTPNIPNSNIGNNLYQNASNSHVCNPNIGRQMYQNTSNPHESNPNIGRDFYPNTSNPHVSNLSIGNCSYQNTSNRCVSSPNIGKILYQNTSDPYVFNPNIGNCSHQNTSNSHVSNPHNGNFSYKNTSNPHVFNPNIANYPYQNPSNPQVSNTNNCNFSYQNASTSRNNPNEHLYEIPIVDAIDEDEETVEYENEEFNRSDDNVLITNKYENKQYTQKPSKNNKQNAQKPPKNNKQHSQPPSEDNKSFARKVVPDPSKDQEWVAIGSGKTLIPAEQFRKVNWKSYTVATRTLLLAVFPRKVLGTHSLTGKKSPAFQDKPAKMCLDPKIVTDVIYEIQDRFDVKENLIRSIITTKCADESKMLKMRKKKLQAAKKENRENEPPNVKEEKMGKSNQGSNV